MTLLDDLNQIKTLIETDLSIKLTDEDFDDSRPEIEHVFLHEACHAAVAHAVPWVRTLEGQAHTAVDELMARFLEMVIGDRHGLFVHSNDGFIRELHQYPVDIQPPDFDFLADMWKFYFWPRRDLDGMAAYALTFMAFDHLVYHILPRVDWEAAQEAGLYRPDSLATEGFIHCSLIEQVLTVADSFYTHLDDLLVLCIAIRRLNTELYFEQAPGSSERFPHIYGPLNLDAVVSVSRLEKDARGRFFLPGGKPEFRFEPDNADLRSSYESADA